MMDDGSRKLGVGSWELEVGYYLSEAKTFALEFDFRI